MNRASNKLAAGVRKVKAQESKPRAAQPDEGKAVAPATAKVSRPVAKPEPMHPENVWPD